MQDQYVTLSAAWFTLSLINAGLAQSKQRSGLAWWLLSLVIGPLATLLIVVSSPGGEPSARQQQALIVVGVLAVLGVLGFLAFRSLAA